MNFRQTLPNSWTTTRFILFFASESSDGTGEEQPSKDEWTADQQNQPNSDKQEPVRSTRQTLERIPEEDESDSDSDEEEPQGPVSQMLDEEVDLQVERQILEESDCDLAQPISLTLKTLHFTSTTQLRMKCGMKHCLRSLITKY